MSGVYRRAAGRRAWPCEVPDDLVEQGVDQDRLCLRDHRAALLVGLLAHRQVDHGALTRSQCGATECCSSGLLEATWTLRGFALSLTGRTRESTPLS